LKNEVFAMTITAGEAPTTPTRLIDARGSFCPGPLMELIRAIRESEVGTMITVRSSDRGSRVDIPKWVEKAGHRLVGVEQVEGYDEIIVEKLH
jgi:TusA-related sulfurtransferase